MYIFKNIFSSRSHLMSLHTSRFNKLYIFMLISQMRKLRSIRAKMLTMVLWLESPKVGTKLVDCQLA